MSDKRPDESNAPEAGGEVMRRRLFLRSMGKWSGAAIAAVIGGAWLASAPDAKAGSWVNRRGGGGWINGRGGGGWINGGGWVNRGGGWINGGGGGWINRWGGGGGAWVNRW